MLRLQKNGYMNLSPRECLCFDISLKLNLQLFIEPEFRTNLPRKKLVNSEPPEERVYEPEGIGKVLKKGDEVSNTYRLHL